MAWTEERVSELKKLWAEGHSASQIAKQLGGVTRNAVIGKVHRLGLSGRATPSRPVKRPPRLARPKPQHVRTGVQAPKPAEAVAKAVDGDLTTGATYELGGPEVKTFRQCLEDMMEVTRNHRLLAPLPFEIASMMGKIMQIFPYAPLTADQVTLLKSDNVVSDAAEQEGRSLAGIGITPTTLAAVLPTYLDRFRTHGQYDAHRPA